MESLEEVINIVNVKLQVFNFTLKKIGTKNVFTVLNINKKEYVYIKNKLMFYRKKHIKNSEVFEFEYFSKDNKMLITLQQFYKFK